MNQAVSAFLSALKIQKPIEVGDLAAFPLVSDAEGEDAELLEDGHTVVKEVHDSGVVNQVLVFHGGKKPLLLVDGEEIIGAKQNRIVNASFLIAAGQETVVPVSCVEQGRWHSKSATFSSSGRTMSSTMRAQKMRRVSTSVSSRGSYDAEQEAVWADVESYLVRSGVQSPTGALDDGVRTRLESIEQRMARLAPVKAQVGIAFTRAGRFVALDVFGSPSLYARAWKKVARGALAEIFADEPAPAKGRPRDRVRRALGDVAKAQMVVKESVGCGRTIHGATRALAWSGVANGSALLHLAVGAAT